MEGGEIISAFSKGDDIMEMRGIMGGFYKISEWIMRLSVINLLWVICSSPFFLLAILPFLTPEDPNINVLDLFYQSIILLAVVAPFTLFPATTAMFAVARKWVLGEEDVPLFKTFFVSYKVNYIQSMIGGILFSLAAAILYVNYMFYKDLESTLNVLSLFFISMFLILGIAFFNFFSVLVHFHMKTLHVFKNAFLITIGRPFASISMIIINLTVMYFSFFKFTFLIPFFMGSIIAYLTFWNFNRLYIKIQEKRQQLEDKEREEAGEALSGNDQVRTDVYPISDSSSTESRGAESKVKEFKLPQAIATSSEEETDKRYADAERDGRLTDYHKRFNKD